MLIDNGSGRAASPRGGLFTLRFSSNPHPNAIMARTVIEPLVQLGKLPVGEMALDPRFRDDRATGNQNAVTAGKHQNHAVPAPRVSTLTTTRPAADTQRSRVRLRFPVRDARR